MELNRLTEERLKRIKNFYQSSCGALINVTSVASFREVKPRPLSAWNFPVDLYKYLDTIIEAAQLHWKQRDEIDDDLLPSVCPWFGIAEHSAILGGDIHFGEITSYQIPFITDWDILDNLNPDVESKWFKIMTESFRYLKEKTAGCFHVRQRGSFGRMDMANAVRGNDFYSDMYDYPDEVRRLLNICEKGMHRYFEMQKRISGELDGGCLSNYSVWMPGNSAGHITEDATVMCSPQMYREFGRPYTEQFCAAYDHVLIHLHGAGKHAFNDIICVPQFAVVEFTNDPKYLPGIELFREYEKLLENKIVMLHLTRKEFEQNREFLKSKKIIIDYAAETIEDAVTIIKSARKM